MSEKILVDDAYINFAIDKKKNNITYAVKFVIPGITPLPPADLKAALQAVMDGMVSPEVKV